MRNAWSRLFKPTNVWETPWATLFVPFTTDLMNSAGSVGKEVLGAAEGIADGALVTGEFEMEGQLLGAADGEADGIEEGSELGIMENVGCDDGDSDGIVEGSLEGSPVGTMVGSPEVDRVNRTKKLYPRYGCMFTNGVAVVVTFKTDEFLSTSELTSRSLKHTKKLFPSSILGSQRTDITLELIIIESTCSAGFEKSVAYTSTFRNTVPSVLTLRNVCVIPLRTSLVPPDHCAMIADVDTSKMTSNSANCLKNLLMQYVNIFISM
jgi:hypothetical protein